VELDRGVGKREALPGAGEPRKPERSGKGGTLRVDGQTPVDAGVLRLAPGERKARRNCRQLARKSPAQVAAAGDLHADRSVVAFEQAAPVLDRELQVGKLERPLGLGEDQ